MMGTNDILKEAAKQVRILLRNRLSPNLKFHNLQHTREVVLAATEIGDYCTIDPVEMEMIQLAAWFHDTGFTMGYQNHEEHGTKIVREFLQTYRYDATRICKIVGCIRATKLPQQPKNLLEAIICDADMFHLSTTNYWKKNKLLKEELTLIFQQPIRNDQWYFENLNFLSHHHYHTPYGLKILAPGKAAHLEENIQKLKELVAHE